MTSGAVSDSRNPRPASAVAPVIQGGAAQSVAAVPPSLSSRFQGSSAAALSGGGAVEVISAPANAAIPAVMASGAVDSPTGVQAGSDEAARAADRISEEFLSNVEAAPADSPEGSAAWNDAAYLADEQFRALYGHDAFLQRSRQAAKETLAAESPQ